MNKAFCFLIVLLAACAAARPDQKIVNGVYVLEVRAKESENVVAVIVGRVRVITPEKEVVVEKSSDGSLLVRMEVEGKDENREAQLQDELAKVPGVIGSKFYWRPRQ